MTTFGVVIGVLVLVAVVVLPTSPEEDVPSGVSTPPRGFAAQVPPEAALTAPEGFAAQTGQQP